LRIRKFDGSDADYQAIVKIDNVVWPEFQATIENWKHWDGSRDSKYRFQRWLLESDGRVVAFGATGDRSWAYQPGQYFVNLNVLPEEEGQGFGSVLFNHLLAEALAMEPKPVRITTHTREDKPRGVRFLEDRGYTRSMRFPRSALDVTLFDPAPFAAKLAQIQQSSIEITSLALLMQRDPEWMRKLYDLEWELVQDVPYHDELTRPEFEVFEKGVIGNPNLLPEAWFIAVDGERWVGMSALWRNPGNPKRLETGLTGVSRDYRRRGLATALKVTAIEYARGRGIEEIETDNEENNPMYQINLRLGYVPQPANLDYVKDITD
jgi:GNAT superfamily N-acetyltransferase